MRNNFKINRVLEINHTVAAESLYRPGSDAALPNLKKSRRVSIAGGDRKKGGF